MCKTLATKRVVGVRGGGKGSQLGLLGVPRTVIDLEEVRELGAFREQPKTHWGGRGRGKGSRP